MGFAGQFVSRGPAGKFDGDEAAFFDEGPDGAVDGGDAKTGGVVAGGVEDFGRGEGALGAGERVLDGLSLRRCALHGYEPQATGLTVAERGQGFNGGAAPFARACERRGRKACARV
jgi:hypothetical protein